MSVKKLLKIVLVAFVFFYVVRSTNSAAGTLRLAGQNAYALAVFLWGSVVHMAHGLFGGLL